MPLFEWFLTCPLLCIAWYPIYGCQGRRHLCRGAEAVSLGPDFQKTIVIPLLQSIDKVFDVSVVQVQQVPRVQSVRRQSRSRSCNRRIRSWTRSLTCPLCSTTNARGSAYRKLQWSRSCSALLKWPMSLLCRSCWCRRCSAVMDAL